MRTTVTLDPDVESLIRACMKERGISFKEALNTGLRNGLRRARPGKARFVQKTYSLGPERNFQWDKALAVAQAIEDEEYSRKLMLRK